MKLTSDSFKMYVEENAGYCKHCDDITADGVEPDAEGYPCPDCDRDEVMGIENALTLEHIDIDEEADELLDDDDELDIIDFGNED